MPLDLSLLASITIIFGAAIVRGFSGFGFSLLAISGLSLLYAPKEVIPAIFMMEIAASLHLLPSVWKDIHWRSLFPLMAGAVIGTPIGVWFLSTLPAAPMQLALSAFVLTSVCLLWIGYSLKSMPNIPSSVAAGAASGLANGAFGIGGPPVILFYFASPAGNIAGRASLIAFFLFTDIIGLAFLSGMADLVSKQTAIKAAIYLPALLLGIWVGTKAFKGVDEAKFRKAVLVLLAVMAVLIAWKALGQ
jgi:uncharacterized membrane protein YfcA